MNTGAGVNVLKELLVTFFSVMRLKNNLPDEELPNEINKNRNVLSERPMLCINRTEIFFSIDACTRRTRLTG